MTAAVTGSTALGSSTAVFLFFFLFFLEPKPQPSSASGSGTTATPAVTGSSNLNSSTFGSSTMALPPFFLVFLDPHPPQSASSLGFSGASGGGGGNGTAGGIGGTVGISFALLFFLFFLPDPHALQESSTPVSEISGSTAITGSETSSMASPFFFFLSFLFTDVNPAQSFVSLPALVSSSGGFDSSSCKLSNSPKPPKSKPDVVIFFLFFLLPPKDQVESSTKSVDVGFVSFEESLEESFEDLLSVTSALVVPIPVKPPHLPQLPRNPEEVSFVPESPNERSILGALSAVSSRRSISSKVFVAAGSGGGSSGSF